MCSTPALCHCLDMFGQSMLSLDPDPVTISDTSQGSDDNIFRSSFWSVITDLTQSYPILLGGPVHWNPAVTWTITFYGRIPPHSEDRSDMTMGLYTHAKSAVDQNSRQVFVTEWWGSANNLEKGKVKEGWREKQVRMALPERVTSIIPSDAERKRTQTQPKS